MSKYFIVSLMMCFSMSSYATVCVFENISKKDKHITFKYVFKSKENTYDVRVPVEVGDKAIIIMPTTDAPVQILLGNKSIALVNCK